MDFNRVYNMDALKGLKALPSNCIDAIISDPPYQLSSITKSRADQTIEGAYGREVPFSRVQAKKMKNKKEEKNSDFEAYILMFIVFGGAFMLEYGIPILKFFKIYP